MPIDTAIAGITRGSCMGSNIDGQQGPPASSSCLGHDRYDRDDALKGEARQRSVSVGGGMPFISLLVEQNSVGLTRTTVSLMLIW